MSGNRKPVVPSPSSQAVPVTGDATHPPVNDNPGEAPQIQMISDAKAIQEAELEANKEASLEAEAEQLKGQTLEVKTSEGKTEKVKAAPMMVVATRAGFYKQSRKQEGDKFVIAGKHEMGDWMKEI